MFVFAICKLPLILNVMLHRGHTQNKVPVGASWLVHSSTGYSYRVNCIDQSAQRLGAECFIITFVLCSQNGKVALFRAQSPLACQLPAFLALIQADPGGGWAGATCRPVRQLPQPGCPPPVSTRACLYPPPIYRYVRLPRVLQSSPWLPRVLQSSPRACVHHCAPERDALHC